MLTEDGQEEAQYVEAVSPGLAWLSRDHRLLPNSCDASYAKEPPAVPLSADHVEAIAVFLSRLARPAVGQHVRLAIGLFTYDAPHAFERRDLIRATWMALNNVFHRVRNPTGTIQVFFVMGAPHTADSLPALEAEQQRHSDLFVLDQQENMNFGKSHAWFVAAARHFNNTTVRYVSKLDDDVALHPIRVEQALSELPRHRLYWGHLWFGHRESTAFAYAAGMFYTLSIDLVLWIAAADIPLVDRWGPEDCMTAWWLVRGRVPVHYVPDSRVFEGLRGHPDFMLRRPLNELLAIHFLKTREDYVRWTAQLLSS